MQLHRAVRRLPAQIEQQVGRVHKPPTGGKAAVRLKRHGGRGDEARQIRTVRRDPAAECAIRRDLARQRQTGALECLPAVERQVQQGKACRIPAAEAARELPGLPRDPDCPGGGDRAPGIRPERGVDAVERDAADRERAILDARGKAVAARRRAHREQARRHGPGQSQRRLAQDEVARVDPARQQRRERDLHPQAPDGERSAARRDVAHGDLLGGQHGPGQEREADRSGDHDGATEPGGGEGLRLATEAAPIH